MATRNCKKKPASAAISAEGGRNSRFVFLGKKLTVAGGAAGVAAAKKALGEAYASKAKWTQKEWTARLAEVLAPFLVGIAHGGPSIGRGLDRATATASDSVGNTSAGSARQS